MSIETMDQGGSERPRTLYDKLWDAHVVAVEADGSTLLYIDRHLVQEVSSPQAFRQLREAGRAVHDPSSVLAMADHAVPTDSRDGTIADPQAAAQVAALEANVRDFGLAYLGPDSGRQGIVHVVGPELGFTLPGTTLVCGDSHTSTHGAFGALAFGIGASECHTVLATQCLRQKRARTARITISGTPPAAIGAKDIALHVIATVGPAGLTGHAVEFAGACVEALSMEQRMTLCNMAIEAGARVGLVAPDAVTFAYLEGRPMAPGGRALAEARAYWETLPTDAGAAFDLDLAVDIDDLAPMVTWGTSPGDALPIDGEVPDPAAIADSARRAHVERALAYMGLEAGTRLDAIAVDRVFIGSCTNARIEDLRSAAEVLRGRRVAATVKAMVVPGSTSVRRMAQDEGLDAVFLAAGFEWRHAGCSMCVAMNADRLAPGERCASTSNRNFEGRQGRGGRTHLMSPAMAAAAAVAGHLVDFRSLG